MSAGNGGQKYGEWRERTVLPLSATERERERLAMRDQIVTLTQQVMALTTARDALMARAAASEQCCQERWDAAAETNKRIGDRHLAFVGRSFLARLRWVLRGR